MGDIFPPKKKQITKKDFDKAIVKANNKLKSRNKSLESSIKDKEKAIKELDGKTKSCNAEIKSLIKVIEDEKKSLLSEKNKVYKVKDEVANIASEVSTLKKDESSLNVNISELKKDKEVLTQDVASLDFQKKEAERLLNEVDAIEEAKSIKDKELASLHENHDNLLDSITTLEETYESMKLKHKEDIEETSEIYFKKVNECKEKEDELKVFEKKSAYKIKVLNEDIQEKNDELSGIKSLVNKAESEFINWNKKIDIQKNRLEEEKKGIERVKKNFEKWKLNVLEDIAKLKLKSKIDNIDKAGF